MQKVFVLLTILTITKYGFSEELQTDAKKIDLSNQHFLEFYQNFSQFTDIEEIDLSNNTLRDLNPTVFKNNRKLHTINLSGNKILAFPKIGPFLESDVKVLNLSDCNLKNIGSNVFDGLNKLTILDLSHNPINFEESAGFQTMSHYPENIIVSNITSTGLNHICRNAYTTIIVLEENKEVSCKDYTKNDINSLDDNPSHIDESMMADDVMLSDMEGSGDVEELRNTEDSSEEIIKDDEKQIEDEETDIVELHKEIEEPKEDKEKIPEDGMQVDDLIEPNIDTDEIEKNEEINIDENNSPKMAEDVNVKVDKNEVSLKKDDIEIEDGSQKQEEAVVPILNRFADIENEKESEQTNADAKEETKSDKSEHDTAVKEENREDLNLEDDKNEGSVKKEDIEIKTGSQEEVVVPILNRFANIENEKEPEQTNADAKKENKLVEYETNTNGKEENKEKDNIVIIPRNNLEEKKTHAEYIEPVDTDSVSSDASKTASSSSNAAVILVIIVALCGTGAVGYKCYKGRKNPRYSSVNGLAKEDPCEGKELKEVKVEGEKKPLMDGEAVVENSKNESAKNEEVKNETSEVEKPTN